MVAFTYINCVYRDSLHRSCFFDGKINFTFFFLIYRRGNDIILEKQRGVQSRRVKKEPVVFLRRLPGRTERGHILYEQEDTEAYSRGADGKRRGHRSRMYAVRHRRGAYHGADACYCDA